MAHMPNFIADIERDLLHRHHDQAATAATTQEHNMISVLGNVNAIVADLAANPLIDQLVEKNLGKALTPEQADTVITIVAALENKNLGPRQATPQPVGA